MQVRFFMQLLIILVLLLYGGKGDLRGMLEEVKPVLEGVGDNSLTEILNEAEELSTVIEAVRALAPEPRGNTSAKIVEEEPHFAQPAVAFPLAPISSIADREITSSLNKYIQSN